MAINIIGTPAQWGIDFLKPENPPWQLVLDEIALAGYKGLELGIYGYLPLDGALVGRELEQRGLSIVAATIFNDLVSEEFFPTIQKQARELCGILSALPTAPALPGQRHPAPYLVLIDWDHEERDYAAGHGARASRLDEGGWRRMLEHIRAVAAYARAHGVRPVIHNHCGSYIEFEDELERLMAEIPAGEAGICVDVGHLAYTGIDPAAWIRRHHGRIDYIHFKDIDPAVHRQVLGERIKFFDGCAKGVMCPIGRGSVDYAAVRRALADVGYSGYICVEQERDPRVAADTSLEDAKKSLAYLDSVGFTI